MFKNLARKLKQTASGDKINKNITSPFVERQFLQPKNDILNKLSKEAIRLYERKNDIQKFTKLAMSNPENTSHNDIVQNLFNEGVPDPFLDEKLEALAENEKFLRDLGLL